MNNITSVKIPFKYKIIRISNTNYNIKINFNTINKIYNNSTKIHYNDPTHSQR